MAHPSNPSRPFARKGARQPGTRQRNHLRIIAIDDVPRVAHDDLGNRHAHLAHHPGKVAEPGHQLVALAPQPAQRTAPIGRPRPARDATRDRNVFHRLMGTLVFAAQPLRLVLEVEPIGRAINPELGVRIGMLPRADKTNIHDDPAQPFGARVPCINNSVRVRPPAGGGQACSGRGGSKRTLVSIFNIAASSGSSFEDAPVTPNRALDASSAVAA